MQAFNVQNILNCRHLINNLVVSLGKTLPLPCLQVVVRGSDSTGVCQPFNILLLHDHTIKYFLLMSQYFSPKVSFCLVGVVISHNLAPYGKQRLCSPTKASSNPANQKKSKLVPFMEFVFKVTEHLMNEWSQQLNSVSVKYGSSF